MKAKSLLARCCCGKGYTGKCKTPCGSNWNNCPASSSGSIFTSLADAYTNCGWFKQGNGAVSGSAGSFSATSGFSQLRKCFAFDYRSGGLIRFQTDLTVPDRTSNASYEPFYVRFYSPSQGVDGAAPLQGRFVFAGQFTSSRFGTTRARNLTADTKPVTTISPGTATQTLKVEADLNSVEIRSTTFGAGSYFNGAVVNADTCIESTKVPVEYFVEGSSVGTGENVLFFQGHRCYFELVFDFFGQASTANTSVTVV